MYLSATSRIAAQLGHRAVDERPHLLAIVFADLARGRGAVHHHQPFLRIGPERGAVGPVPGEIAPRPRRRRDSILKPNRDAQTEAIALAMRLDRRDVISESAEGIP